VCLNKVKAFVLLLAFVIAVFAGVPAFAQISSLAFDPNCYQPTIGTPGEIDTIMGDYKGQQLGGGMINIGPSPLDPHGPGRLMFTGLSADTSFSIVNMGPSFDPHNMNFTTLKGFLRGSTMLLGHFRSPRYWDIYCADSLGNTMWRPKIFLQDSLGNYDIDRYETLNFTRKILYGAGSPKRPYHAYVTSDSVEDLVLLYGYHTDFTHDSLFFAHFKGGNLLDRAGQLVYPEDEVYFDSAHSYNHSFSPPDYTYCADFRGSGRVDCVATNNNGDLFYYRNDPPFDLKRFASSMKDTFFSAEIEPRIHQGSNWGFIGLTMKAFAKSNDLTAPTDLLLYLDSGAGQIRIFRGSSSFGSHRLTLDSTYTLESPLYYDHNTFPYEEWGTHGLKDCGDMTGTGNNVLYVGGLDFLTGNENFYVLGDAIDDKIDMYFGGYMVGGTLDTCTLDNDGLQDVAMGDPGYNMDNKLSGDDKGTVRFIHGSRKIPVRLNLNIVRERHPELEGNLTVAPNPCSSHTVVTWESACSGSVNVRLIDLLGRVAFEETRRTTGSLESFSLDIPPLPAGDYVLQLIQSPCTQYAKVVIAP